jgi:hypothetical protein
MHTHADKKQENKSQSVANTVPQKQNGGETTFQFVDNRPEAVTQRKSQEIANNSPQVSQLRASQDMANNSAHAEQVAQLQPMADNASSQQQEPTQKKENNTGLPDNLKTGMENLSGMPLDDVKVHRNSDKPAQLQAHAYAQGTDIHLGAGQEKHLPHEAWHVVQQKQGRVKPTMQMKGKVNVNDDAGLEKEADVMGAKAVQMKGGMHGSRPAPVSVKIHTEKVKDNKNQSVAGEKKQMQANSESSLQFVDNRSHTVGQRKLQEMADDSLRTEQALQLQALTSTYDTQQQQPVQGIENKTVGEVVQLAKGPGKNRVIEAKKAKNQKKRSDAAKAKAKDAEEAAAWSDTVSDWASWAWEKTQSIGLDFFKEAGGGIDPFEVTKTLKSVYGSDVAIKTKLYYLAIYGSSQAATYLSENMATIIGGDVGAMMELEGDINEQLEASSRLWENGEIEEGEVDSLIVDKIVGVLE